MSIGYDTCGNPGEDEDRKGEENSAAAVDMHVDPIVA
jgi:hypothetical protein